MSAISLPFVDIASTDFSTSTFLVAAWKQAADNIATWMAIGECTTNDSHWLVIPLGELLLLPSIDDMYGESL